MLYKSRKTKAVLIFLRLGNRLESESFRSMIWVNSLKSSIKEILGEDSDYYKTCTGYMRSTMERMMNDEVLSPLQFRLFFRDFISSIIRHIEDFGVKKKKGRIFFDIGIVIGMLSLLIGISQLIWQMPLKIFSGSYAVKVTVKKNADTTNNK